jgi:phosphatidate cytidylyltransferase
MADAEPGARPAGGSNLRSRVIMGAILAVAAVAVIWVGGPAFTLMIAAGVGLVLWEWGAMHGTPQPWRIAGLAALAAACALAHIGRPLSALLLLGAILALLLLSTLLRAGGRHWVSAGLVYGGLPAVSLIWLRSQPDGLALVMWTMGLVWATDILAYFAGRAIGGPKIWPAISPSKTWAGLLGGMAGAALWVVLWVVAIEGGIAGPRFQLGLSLSGGSLGLAALLGAALAVTAQAGDFFDSWLKRRAGVKDSSRLIPGHGGVFDRIDGMLPVAIAVGAIGSILAN